MACRRFAFAVTKFNNGKRWLGHSEAVPQRRVFLGHRFAMPQPPFPLSQEAARAELGVWLLVAPGRVEYRRNCLVMHDLQLDMETTHD